MTTAPKNNRRGISMTSGVTDKGDPVNFKATAEGHLETDIHGPRLPFGSIHTESLEPVFQADFVYGINPDQWLETTGINGAGTTSATITGTNNLGKCSTGTTALSFSSLQTKERLRYRPGQGVVDRFTMMFSEPAANSILVSGIGTSESGFYFGYNGTSFGILHSTGGVREIQTLTVTTASTDTNDYEVELNGTTFNVTATNNNSTTKTAYEISQGTFTGWTAEQIGNTVVFLANAVGNKAGSFSLAQTGAATPAAGSFAETLAGAAGTDNWVPQEDWNGDKLDGSGPSGVTIDPQKLNVAQIFVQYLGAGPVVFKVEVSPENNDPTFVVVHTLRFNNAQTTTSITQPSFPHTLAAYSAGSTTDVWVASASVAGFVEGKKKLTGPRLTFNRETSGFVGSAADTYYPLFTVRNSIVHGHNGIKRANQSIINILAASLSHDDATPIGFYLIRNATLTGTPNFQAFSTVSCADWDTAAATCTIDTNEQLLSSVQTGQASGEIVDFTVDDFTLRPGETLTLAARAATGSATYVNASLNTREDQ